MASHSEAVARPSEPEVVRAADQVRAAVEALNAAVGAATMLGLDVRVEESRTDILGYPSLSLFTVRISRPV